MFGGLLVGVWEGGNIPSRAYWGFWSLEKSIPSLMREMRKSHLLFLD